MELLNLRCSNKQESLSKHQILKFSYQWRVINFLGMKTHSFNLSHSLSKKFIQSSYDLGIELPNEITEKLCIRCSALLLPGISCSIRIKKCNKHKQHKNKLKQSDDNDNQTNGGLYKNEVHIRCHTCGLIGQKMDGCPKTITTTKINDNDITTNDNTTKESSKTLQIVENNKKSKKKNSFSFMNRIKGSSSKSPSSSSTTTIKSTAYKASKSTESFKKAGLPPTGLGTLGSLFRSSSS